MTYACAEETCVGLCRVGSTGTGTGCTETTYSSATTLVGTMNTPNDLLVDDVYVYFTDTGDNSIWRIAKTGGALTQLAANQANPMFIAADQTHVYWNNQAGNSIARVAKNGGVVDPLVSTNSPPMNIAVDESSVYWIADVSFYSAPKTGGTPVIVGTPSIPRNAGLPPWQLIPTNRRLAYPLRYYDGVRFWTPTEGTPRSQYLLGRHGEWAWATGLDNGSTIDWNRGQPIDLVGNGCTRYWITSAAVRRASPLPNVSDHAITWATNPRRITADDQFVYWTEGRSVRKAATGDNVTP